MNTPHDPYAHDVAPMWDGTPDGPTPDEVFSPEEAATTLEYYAAKTAKRGDSPTHLLLEYIAHAVRSGIATAIPDAEILDSTADAAFKGGRHGESHDLRTIAELIRMGAK